MGILQITSHRPQAGKTSLAAVALLTLARLGKPAGYYKPFCVQPGGDSDLAFIQEAILSPQGGPAAPSPSILEPSANLSEPQLQQLSEAVTALQAAHPRVVLEGPDLETSGEQASALAVQIASQLDSRVIVILRYSKDHDSKDHDSDGLAGALVSRTSEAFGGRLAGVIINCVTKHRLAEVRQRMETELAPGNIPLLGVIPESRIMRAPTVQQIADTLGGRWIQEPASSDQPVERFLIGGNIMDSGPEYYGRYENQAVITRSQRPDIQLASLVAGTKCLVLTEGGEPTEYIKAEAMERGVPVMVVESKTLETVDALAPLLDTTPAHNLAKVQVFAKQLAEYLDLEQLAALTE